MAQWSEKKKDDAGPLSECVSPRLVHTVTLFASTVQSKNAEWQRDSDIHWCVSPPEVS